MNHLVADNAVQVLGGRGVTQTGMGRVVEVGTNSFIIIVLMLLLLLMMMMISSMAMMVGDQ